MSNKLKMSGNTYDILKALQSIILPALATFYVSLSAIWGWPYGEEVTGIMMIVETILGVYLKLSSDDYWNDI